MADAKSPVVAPTENAEEDGRKVFVGNLAFSVTDEDLSTYFSTVGKVLAANVIKRGIRSMGYGFVTFESETDAQLAHANLNKKEFNGREINVELAKTRDPNAPSTRGRGIRGRGRRPAYGQYDDRFNGYAPRYPPRYDDGYGYEPRAYFPRGRGGFRGGRRGRGGLRTSERRTGEPSKNTLFIANIPYSMTDAGLTKLFEGFAVVKSHVVTLRNGKSKGYGFVEFDSEDEQKRALLGLNNAVVEDRPLVVKIALNIPAPEAEEAPAQE